MEIRNHLVCQVFKKLNCDLLVLVDSDELLSRNIKTVILQTFSDPKIDSLCFSIWHLYNKKKYIHFWETHMNGTYLIDPHIRVIRKSRRYEMGYPDGSHPFIRTTDLTRCIHGPYHYHLKYYHKSPYPNYSLGFLPEYPTPKQVKPYLRNLSFPIPADVRRCIDMVDWSSISRMETSYYASYKSTRTTLTSREASIHPRDKK